MKLAEKFIDNDNEYHECRNFNLSLWNGRQKKAVHSLLMLLQEIYVSTTPH